MHPLFDIQTNHIQALDDGQARELLARLCRSQLQRAGLDPAAVFWGGNQRAGDGGVDVRVDGPPAREVGGPLGLSVAIVQVKAEAFGPAKVESEMAPKGIVRPSIVSLAADGGAYLIASTRDDPADPKRRARVAAMEKVVGKHGLTGMIKVDFLGAREIANWVENFPSLAVWVRKAVGRSIQGWSAYGPWAYKETDQDAEFVVGSEPRVFSSTSTEGMTDLQAIEAIRRDLAAGGTVRLVGLSGVGKTRLAQAIFDTRVKTGAPALSPDWAMYTDISNSPDPSPEAMIDALASSNAKTVLIVDNCGQKTHAALVERKAKSGNQLGLLTIEYDIQDDLPEETTFYRLEGTSEETMSTLLQARCKHLSHNDIRKVIDASDGNSRLAFALASTSKHTDDLSSLKDTELFRRLFEQSQGAGDELLRCAKAASLLYSFDGEDLSPTSEIAILAGLAGTTPADFRRNMIDLRRRGLLQERGKWRALLPHAVSNRLAALALEELLEPVTMDQLFVLATDRVRASFAHRMSFLHNSTSAVRLVSDLLAPGGHFSDLGSISDKDLLIFLRFAAVAPSLALDTIGDFATKGDLGIRNEYDVEKLAQLSSSIAYDPSLFDRCVRVLLDLTPLLSKDHRTGAQKHHQLSSLFQLYYSGTLTLTAKRAPHVKRLLAARDSDEVKIGLTLLGESLKVRNFRPASHFHFGARTRSYGWWPKSSDEQRTWYSAFIEIAEDYAFRDDYVGREVRNMLGKAVFGLVQDEVLFDRISKLAPRLIACDDWLPAMKSLNDLLKHKDLEIETRERATAFKQLISPKDLRAKIHAVISMRDAWEDEEDEEDYLGADDRATVKSERLGQQLASDEVLLREMLPMLLGEGAKPYTVSVGRGVALATTDPSSLMSQVKDVILASGDITRLNSIFVFGLISGWNERDTEMTSKLLDTLVSDAALGSWLPTLQFASPLTKEGAQRIRQALALGLAPLWRYRELGYGSRLASVSVTDIRDILNDLASKGPDGMHAALDVLHMVVFSAGERTPAEQEELGHYCRNFLTREDWPNLDHEGERLDYEVEQLIKFGAKHSRSFDEVQGVLLQAVRARSLYPRYTPSTTGNFLSPILRRYAPEALNYLLNLDETQRHVLNDLAMEESSVDSSERMTSPISEDTLVEWCAADPSHRVLLAARLCQLNGKNGNGPQVTQRLYELAPDKSAFMAELTKRGLTSGSSDWLLPILRQLTTVLASFPTQPGTPDRQTQENEVRRVNSRIDSWEKMLAENSRGRDETFE
ncbi:hypothetical protein QEK82_000630 [Stenotrophomonas maltophilia]|uniref:hypothetical protein n=1 Tax=Stenotrophomonas maltophilia group sp. Smal13 TaxID=3377166 RepID=UPI001312D518|nr:hypothetical protein [Stenotrophomonas maltophilia]EKU9957755.1 hypothetical protein [Stenotrophomonas maltophilia]EKU9983855.1 hypothetical protein [Stenotrophomonas maltophilia]